MSEYKAPVRRVAVAVGLLGALGARWRLGWNCWIRSEPRAMPDRESDIQGSNRLEREASAGWIQQAKSLGEGLMTGLVNCARHLGLQVR